MQKIMVVFPHTGAGSNAGILMGIGFAVRRAEITGRKSIISMSLGGVGMSRAMDITIQNAFFSGVLVVGE
jgi:Zn-dependent alcohol dehydrogenase